MSVDLLFRSAPQTGPSWDLVFGADEVRTPVVVDVDLGSPVFEMTVLVDPATVSRHCGASWREGAAAAAAAGAPWSDMQEVARAVSAPWAPGAAVGGTTTARWAQSQALQRALSDLWRDAAELRLAASAPWRQGIPVHGHGGGRWRDGAVVDTWAALPWRQGERLSRTVETLARQALFSQRYWVARSSDGVALHRRNHEPWRDGQLRVSYGIPWPPFQPPEPPGHVCYTPSTTLLFRDGLPTNSDLLFVCDHGPGPAPGVIVPIRSVYMVTNSVSVVRVVDGVPIPADSLRLQLDAESWAWGFSINLPANLIGLVEPTSAGPVELLATINGTAFRLLAEQVSRERMFGSVAIRVQGRSRIAELDAPYAAVMSFSNADARTAQQLMGDALTLNGVPLGWTVDWDLDDWLVPAGIWSHQGTHVSALTAIAQSAGAYVLPHPSAKSLKVQHRYPVAPWDWAGVTPDLVLPSDVTRRESMDWLAGPAYNRVFIAPQGSGINGYQVTRDGTAGDLVAPLVVDPLMTDVAVARQRARAELGRGGRQITIGLGLPVLPETGIVLPGTFVQYTDGADTRRGIVRSVAVESAFPNVWQTIGVEAHV